MHTVYGPKQVATLCNVSTSAIRNYTARYGAYMSQGAAETPRQFSEADLRVIAFVRDCTSARLMTHAETAAALAAGALDDFEWTPPEVEPPPPFEPSTALVPVSQLEAARLVMEDARRREEIATAKNEELQARIETLQRELGAAQGELHARQRRRPKWLTALIGE
jgi:DNA-binding transcriptional MerR regulator